MPDDNKVSKPPFKKRKKRDMNLKKNEKKNEEDEKKQKAVEKIKGHSPGPAMQPLTY